MVQDKKQDPSHTAKKVNRSYSTKRNLNVQSINNEFGLLTSGKTPSEKNRQISVFLFSCLLVYVVAV